MGWSWQLPGLCRPAWRTWNFSGDEWSSGSSRRWLGSAVTDWARPPWRPRNWKRSWKWAWRAAKGSLWVSGAADDCQVLERGNVDEAAGFSVASWTSDEQVFLGGSWLTCRLDLRGSQSEAECLPTWEMSINFKSEDGGRGVIESGGVQICLEPECILLWQMRLEISVL